MGILIPFGGDHPIIIEAMTRTALSIGINPKEIWTVMSSGVLSRNYKVLGLMLRYMV